MKLNLCCGSNVFPGWLNVDRTDVDADYLKHLRDAPKSMQWPPEQQALVDRIGEIQFMRHDVRKGLPWADASVEAIYVGQAIEHFNRRTEAPVFLRECARVLKTGGVIKLTTPCLRRLIDDFNEQDMDKYESDQPAFYDGALPEDQLSYLLFGASGADCTSQNYEGHFHCYTPRSLTALVHEAGFLMHIGDEFHDTIDKGMSHSFAIEAVKQ